MNQFDLLIYVFIEDYKGCEGICQTWVEYLSNKLQILSGLSQYYICKVSIYCKLLFCFGLLYMYMKPQQK